MMAAAFPGVDPETLPTPEEVAKAIVPLCLPGCTENGKLYDFRAGQVSGLPAAGVNAALNRTQCFRFARPLNGLSFSRSVSRIGVPGRSKLSRSELTR